jgi:acyl-CoA synthetase (AMP-forming)/AMP-acid ligase II
MLTAESVGVDLRIVDVSTCGNNNGVVSGHALEEERVGEIWVRFAIPLLFKRKTRATLLCAQIKSPSCAAGYWGLQDKSIEDFHARVEGQEGGYMRTGDLGCTLILTCCYYHNRTSATDSCTRANCTYVDD